MRKYRLIFSLAFQNEFIYRLNFVLWRFRNVLRVLLAFFLWSVVFTGRDTAFGYTRPQMLGYVLFVLVIQTLVMSAPSNDNVGGEIANGDLSNYLLKPVSYLKSWFTRDLASKLLNILFSVGEIVLLWLLLRPEIYLSFHPVSLLLGLLLWISGVLIYFFLTKIAVFAAFWTPENTWGFMFVILVFMEVLSGAIFPLDVLPGWVQSALQFTPFPYLIYYPIGIFVDRFSHAHALRLLAQSLIWLGISIWLSLRVWRAGLKNYSATGR